MWSPYKNFKSTVPMHSLFNQPIPSDSNSGLEILEAHQVTYTFYEEVRYRQDFEAYCQWYYDTAERHRQEFESMKNDLNILGWFCRK